jgi:hypothetical protein
MTTGNKQPDPKRLTRLLDHQFNVITRHQALAIGITRSALRHKLRRGGPWRTILPGVYVTETGSMTPEQREMAALLYAGRGSVITGAAAVRRFHLTCAGLNEIDVLVRIGARRQSAGLARIQHTSRMPTDLWSTRGLRFAPLPRAVADAARGMKRFEDVQAVVCEAVQRGRCQVEELIEELNAGPKTGSRFFREALLEIAAGIRSVAEGELKQEIDRSNLEKPMYNPRLYLFDGRTFTLLGIPDAWWQRAYVAAEVDSLQYHFKAKDHEETVARHNRMEAEGIHMLHFLPRNIKPERQIILAQLRDAIAAGCQRPPLPILAVPADVIDIETYLITHAAAVGTPTAACSIARSGTL